MLSVAVPATSRPSGAADEIDRQVALYGVGSDLVLRNVPPVRVHRLRFSAADTRSPTGWRRRAAVQRAG